MTEPMPTIVCVLGMHRSGTSFITRALSSLGVFLGPDEHAVGPREDNPQGFSEHHQITHLNDEMLIRLGGSWHTPPPLPPRWEMDPRLEGFAARARQVVEDDFGRTPLWGWKDPRTCLTLPFWQRLLPPMRYVICVRSPLAVALSLQARDQFTIEKGAGLWVAHTAAALAHTAGKPRILVAYDDVLERPESELERLAAFVGRPSSSADSVAAVRAFTDVKLRHHRTPIAEVLDDRRLPFAAKALYLSILLRLEAQRRSASEPDSPHPHEAAVDHFAEQARLAEDAAHARSGLEEELRARTQSLTMLEQRIGELSAAGQRAQQLEADGNRLREFSAGLQVQLDEARRRLQHLETATGSINAACRALLPPRVYLELRRVYDRVRAR